MTIVLDTCALLLLVDGSYDLPPELMAEPFALSAVTWCEVAWKHRLGKLALSMDLRSWCDEVDQLEVTTHAIDREIFLRAVALEWDHRDPADRLIVALAQVLDAPLVTCDPVIQAWYPRWVW